MQHVRMLAYLVSFLCMSQWIHCALPGYVPFQKSMRVGEFSSLLNDSYEQRVLSFFEQMYERTSFAQVSVGTSFKIPKIIHYIWLGKKLPREYLPFLQTWLDLHPDWSFVFWVDNPENYDLGDSVGSPDFPALDTMIAHCKGGERLVVDVHYLQYANRCFFDGSKNYGERSDILRWEVVYRYGGTYIDVDCECFKSLDVLHQTYDFFTGIQPLDTATVQLGAALFGAIPHHPLLEHCVRTIADDQVYQQIVVRTGPLHFTKSFIACAGKTGLLDCALPASYFYPCAYGQAGHLRSEWIQPESFATHHWAGSWLKKDGWKS